ncbi:hypothetical protein NC652_016995 [Populus alba x Populus x berolinensis]|nr:hypothetical protein NC652_016995 [Populus alba x Populus x berolinensis]
MTTRVKGTLGYLAPEYAIWGKVSESCDVYSFGILLITKGRFKELADPKLRGNFDENQFKQSINVAALCVQSEPENRPTMKVVVSMLKGYDPRGKVMQTRIKSVKYKEELQELDQTSDGENDGGGLDEELLELDQTSDGENDGGGLEESTECGVFGPMEVQNMQDPYMRHGDGKKIGKNM